MTTPREIHGSNQAVNMQLLLVPAKVARIVKISSHGFGISLDIDDVSYLAEFRKLIVILSDGQKTWSQSLTKVKVKRKKKAVYLATGNGASILKELYVAGRRALYVLSIMPERERT